MRIVLLLTFAPVLSAQSGLFTGLRANAAANAPSPRPAPSYLLSTPSGTTLRLPGIHTGPGLRSGIVIDGLPLTGATGYWITPGLNAITLAPKAPPLLALPTPTGPPPEPMWGEFTARLEAATTLLETARAKYAELRASATAQGNPPPANLAAQLAVAQQTLAEASRAAERRAATEAEAALRRLESALNSLDPSLR